MNQPHQQSPEARFEAIRKQIFPNANPNSGFRSLGDELGGHENAVAMFGIRAAGKPLKPEAKESPEPGEPGDKD